MKKPLLIKDNRIYELDKNEKNIYFKNHQNEKIIIDQKMSKFLDRIANKSLEELEENEMNKNNSKVFLFPDDFNKTKKRDNENDDDKVYILKTTKDNDNKITSLSTQLTGNLVGFLGEGQQQLLIKSRFDNDDNNYFLFYMLSRALKIPFVHSFEFSRDPLERMIEYYIFLFPLYLKNAMKKGPYKTYVKKQYNDANVKGVIDVQRHINHNVPFVGKIAYNQREFSYDNYLMELIRHTIAFIKSRYGNELFASVKEQVKIIEELTPSFDRSKKLNVIRENKKNIVRSNYFSEYRTLQELCICILEYKKIGISGDSNDQIYGVLFDASWIWEEYVNTLIKDEFYHPQNKEKIGTQYLFRNTDNGRDTQEIYPDFIGKDKSRRVIADAKYKPIENIGRDDYFQVLAYMLRFDSSLAFYLYPSTEEEKADKRFEILKGLSWGSDENSLDVRSDEEKLYVIKHGLIIPKSGDDFHEFQLQMEKNEEKFLAEFN